MVHQIVQVHVFRPAETAAASNRVFEQRAFARQLDAARSRIQGPETGRTPARQTREAREATAPWLRSDAKRALAASIEHASDAVGVPPALAVGVAIAESSLDPTAQAADGLSSGTFQVRPSTAADMRRLIARGDLPRPPGAEDVSLGIGYLKYLDGIFSQATELRQGLETTPVANAAERRLFAVAAFNAGQGRVATAQARAAAGGGDPARYEDVRPYLPSITRTYVDRVSHYAGAPRTAGAPA